MMASYFVNRRQQPNGDHEIHVAGCKYLPGPESRIFLGKLFTCQTAVLAAKTYYRQVNGCLFCSRDCHTS